MQKRGTAIDAEKKVVTLDDNTTISYDYLIIAVGSENAAALKTNERIEAARLLAEMKALSDRLKQVNKLVVVGGGPVGVECGMQTCYMRCFCQFKRTPYVFSMRNRDSVSKDGGCARSLVETVVGVWVDTDLFRQFSHETEYVPIF